MNSILLPFKPTTLDTKYRNGRQERRRCELFQQTPGVDKFPTRPNKKEEKLQLTITIYCTNVSDILYTDLRNVYGKLYNVLHTIYYITSQLRRQHTTKDCVCMRRNFIKTSMILSDSITGIKAGNTEFGLPILYVRQLFPHIFQLSRKLPIRK